MAQDHATPYDPHAPHPFHSRKNMRWEGYDYTSAADYFITVVVHDRLCLFGNVEDNHVNLSPAGEMIDEVIGAMINRYDGLELLGKVIMPNHIHLVIGKYEERAPLPELMDWMKSLTTNRYGDGVRQQGWTPYHDKLWQHSYYDHIVRNERALQYILRYIDENPARWSADKLNPVCETPDEIMKTILDIELGTPPPTKVR